MLDLILVALISFSDNKPKVVHSNKPIKNLTYRSAGKVDILLNDEIKECFCEAVAGYQFQCTVKIDTNLVKIAISRDGGFINKDFRIICYGESEL